MNNELEIRQTRFDTIEEFQQLVELQNEVYRERNLVFTVDSFKRWYFDNPSGRVLSFNAFDGEKIAAFCLLEDWGVQEGLRIGGPGCVGTVPEYRKQGIGLEMVRLATELVQNEGFDISWIHYTHLEKWYSKLGYHTILRWGCKGFID